MRFRHAGSVKIGKKSRVSRVPCPVLSPSGGPADGVLDQLAVGRVEMRAFTVAELDVDNARLRVRADPGHGAAGVGYKLTDYFARIYAKTDVEYLQEDNIPIIVQDDYHARCGSSLVLNPGTPTVHIMYDDPVKGPTQVCTSLAADWAFPSLPLSFIVPTSDPLYFPDPTLTEGAALENRSYIYDCALAIIAFAGSGNFVAAARIIKQLDAILDNPGYLAAIIFENSQDGQSASRWTKSNSADSVTDVNNPTEPPYGTGLVTDFHATAAYDTFTYSGSGLAIRN